MNLIIDIGNTQIKCAVFQNNTLVLKRNFEFSTFISEIKKILDEFPIRYSISASVNHAEPSYIQFLNDHTNHLILDHTVELPFKNKYATPHTLGVDRIALIAAAVSQFPQKNTLVIDAGSCITYDFVNDKKEYFGGAISPGVLMRYKALHQFTAKLPFLTPLPDLPTHGNSTENAIHLGVLQGVISEIEGIVNQYNVKNCELITVLTGGDTNFLAKNLKSTIFANPNFLLEGLNSILTYKIDE